MASRDVSYGNMTSIWDISDLINSQVKGPLTQFDMTQLDVREVPGAENNRTEQQRPPHPQGHHSSTEFCNRGESQDYTSRSISLEVTDYTCDDITIATTDEISCDEFNLDTNTQPLVNMAITDTVSAFLLSPIRSSLPMSRTHFFGDDDDSLEDSPQRPLTQHHQVEDMSTINVCCTGVRSKKSSSTNIGHRIRKLARKIKTKVRS